jgi:hypothetical protein
MKLKQSFFAIYLLGILLVNTRTQADTGHTTIAKWKDNKQGAYTLRFDDSMMSHKDHTIPNLVKRGLVASFYINPATNRYGYGIDAWESQASRIGIELCPHSMNHIGAGDYEEADYEIGESYKTVWKLNPPDKSKLYPFSRGGGTSWPEGYREVIQSKYPVAEYSGLAIRYGGADDRKELIDFAKKAMQDDAWHTVLTHGTGPNLEWLGFEVSNFEALLDYLASVKDKLWIGNAGDVYKYVMERESAKISSLQVDDQKIQFNLTSEIDPELYDHSLTLITEVSPDWNFCHIHQDKRESIRAVRDGRVMYEALPNRGMITLTASEMDKTPPAKIEIHDGLGEDIDVSPFTTQISANWDAAVDPESGISRYWYKVGITPGGSEVLDWIDNGLARSFSTSRTNLYLIRGEKYYITIKAVNGVGLSSESTSDGFVVNTIPGYISFKEDFDSGYLSQWTEKYTRESSDKNILYLTSQAAREGNLGLQCHLEDGQRGQPFIAKHQISENNEVFTRFYVKMSDDFQLSTENGSIQLLELRDEAGVLVAKVSIGMKEGIGYHVHASSYDNKGYNASLPGFTRDYPHSYIAVKTGEWIRIDLRTVAHEHKGGAELWVNGVRKGCITNRFTAGKDARNLYVGLLDINGEHISGDIFIDDIAISDSYLR